MRVGVLICAAALLGVAGCGGGSGGGCGSPSAVPPGAQGGKYGGNLYAKVPGQPIVSTAGGGTTCDALLALANEYAAGHVGRPFFQWLAAHGWTWMNASQSAFAKASFDTNKYDLFVGTATGRQSQVAFPAT